MRRVFIRGAFLLVTFAAGCSSFGASPGGSSGEIPDGGDAEAASGVDGGPPSPSARCEGVPPATEYAGLYVAAGNAEGSETDEIVRAPLRCDGSVGDWKTLDVKLPRTFAWGGVTVIEDRVVLFGGQHSAGGAVYSKQAWVGTRTADGTLGKLIPTPDIEDLARWRFAVAETTKAAYVLGGVIPNSSEDAAAAPEGTATILFDGGFQTVTKRIDRLSFSSSGTLQSRRVADIYTPLTRFVASAAGDRLVAHGGIGSGAAIQVADIDANGDLGPWRSVGDFVAGQFDGTAVPSGDGVYLIGGEIVVPILL